MEIFKDIKKFKNRRKEIKKTVGFVPTMGALHEGHLSLIKKSRSENEITIVSIFVNPTQFNDKNDLKKYPRPLKKDIKLLSDENVDILITPSYEGIYPDGYRYKLTETDFSKKLCGKFRPGHFDGVLTVVMKLFNIVKPDRAYFGEKDYQQYVLIKGMAKAFFLDIEIVGCTTVREPDGLAKSSRNLLLNPEKRKKASLIYETMTKNISDKSVKKILNKNGFKVEYVETINDRRFVAAKLGNVRLIDNIKMSRRSE